MGVYRRTGPVRRWLRRVTGRPASRRTHVYGPDRHPEAPPAVEKPLDHFTTVTLGQLGILPFTRHPNDPCSVEPSKYTGRSLRGNRDPYADRHDFHPHPPRPQGGDDA